MSAAVRLPRPLALAILAEAQASPEREVCGLLGGRGDRAVSRYPVPNAAEDPARRFRMEPRAQIAAFREMRRRGETLYAIYHSHPRGPALPSAVDLAEAAYPEAFHLIAGLGTRGVLELRAFRIQAGRAEALPLEVLDEEAMEEEAADEAPVEGPRGRGPGPL
ncbi:MAG: M67 family peptidase [Gammaproteobacteria bacterium]|nr:MAG: M67 family peptidase [Gammaproteobacteria bacterium]